MDSRISPTLRHNLIVNILDGGFFGFALGFASFVTVIPLFVNTLTDSAILIGLIPAIHAVGWQLPQLLTANRVSRLRYYKPMVVHLTIHERLPFLGLAAVAWMASRLGNQTALLLTFLLLIWQGLGGGFTATAWQSMIGKLIPPKRRGTFFGLQSSAANGLSSLGAVFAGWILSRMETPLDFVTCFILAGISMLVSWIFLAQTREQVSPPPAEDASPEYFWSSIRAILKGDRNFRWFLVMRMLSQLATMAFAFYTVYAVNRLGVSEVTIGIMTAVFLITQLAAGPVMGWLGDIWSHRALMEIGLFSATASAMLAWRAPGPAWFYLVFILAGVANTAIWTIGLAMILEFGAEPERPAYIGLANTLVAPSSILAPFLGGWLAELAGYPAAFIASSLGGLATVLILQFLVRDPKQMRIAS